MIRLAIRVRRKDAELVLAELIELAPGGVEEVSLGDVVEYAVYGPPGELPALPDLKAAAGEALVDVSSKEIADDWAERWRAFHVPLVLEGKLTIRPPWERAGGTPVDIVIDPGQAFGTGAHATTRLCLELLLDLKPRGSLLDLGCGSGVLGIAAVKLGFDPVIGVDNDPTAVEVSRENARMNGVELELHRRDVRRDPLPVADTVLANLLAPLLHAWCERLAVAAPQTVVAGGLLEREADEVAAAFAARGLGERGRRTNGDWAALLLGRAS